MSLNLHKIVRGAITRLHDDVGATLYRSTGEFEEGEHGDPVQVFAEGIPVRIQIQTLSADVIQHVDDINRAASLRKIYVHSSEDAGRRLWAMMRPLSRTGDYLNDELGRWWLINAVIEDFTRAGWISAQAQLQTTPPQFRVAYEDECSCDCQL